jgi:hypothetical protein
MNARPSARSRVPQTATLPRAPGHYAKLQQTKLLQRKDKYSYLRLLRVAARLLGNCSTIPKLGAEFCVTQNTYMELQIHPLLFTGEKLGLSHATLNEPKSSVGIATDYGPDGRGSIRLKKETFLLSSVQTGPPIQWYRGGIVPRSRMVELQLQSPIRLT